MTTRTRPAVTLSPAELERYTRQIRLDGFGLEGQRRLKAATVLISRVGGVGGTVATLLARAGVGRLILAHGGRIVPEYLNRMPLAVPADIGRPCTDVFVEKLRAINPDLTISALSANVTEETAEALAEPADLIVDGAPLFEERFALNRAAVRQQKPLVMAAMYGLEGYVTTFLPGETGCLVCLYPDKPDDWTSIEVFPAMGPAPSLMGTVAAMEAIKVLTGVGQSLAGVLWHCDLATVEVQRLRIHRRDDCAVCGPGAAPPAQQPCVPTVTRHAAQDNTVPRHGSRPAAPA